MYIYTYNLQSLSLSTIDIYKYLLFSLVYIYIYIYIYICARLFIYIYLLFSLVDLRRSPCHERERERELLKEFKRVYEASQKQSQVDDNIVVPHVEKSGKFSYT